MKCRSGIRADSVWAKHYGAIGFKSDHFFSAEFIRLKKYANGKKHDGPCGWRNRPNAVLHRALAEMARAYKARKKHG